MSPSSAAAPPDTTSTRAGLATLASDGGVSSAAARPTRADTIAAALVVGAALIHVLLLPAPPGQAVPEKVPWVGVLSLILEIAAVAALAVGLPVHSGTRKRAGSLWMPALAAGLAVFLLDLVAAGDLSYSQVTIPRPDAVGVYANGLGSLSPALTATVNHRWSLYLPLLGTALALLVAGLLAAAVRMTLEVVRRRRQCSARLGLLGVVPASFAAPVCCGPSLLSAAGVGAAAALSWLATPLLLLAATFLGIDILWLWRRSHS